MSWGRITTKMLVSAGVWAMSALSLSGLSLSALAVPAQAATTSATPCIKVHKVTLEGVHLLPRKVLAAKTDALVGKCLDGNSLNAALKAISFAYIDKGYITARAYVPAQDLSKTKTLRLVVVEGRVEGFYVDGKPAEVKHELAHAFPSMQSKPLNLRDIEQGLDQMNAVAGTNAKSDLVAAKQAGGSFINITGKPKGAPHLTLSNNNNGSRQTGYSQSSGTLLVNDYLHWNEQLALTYTHTGPDYPFYGEYGLGYSNSLSGSFTIPYGYWTANLHGTHYTYESKIPGLFSNINTTGSSDLYGASISRVVNRNQYGKTSITLGLDYKASNNFLLGNVIETGTRRYTVASISLDQSLKALKGLWSFDLTYAHGLGIFDATPPGAPGVGDSDPLFGKINANISYLRPFTLASTNFEYMGQGALQWSPSPLLGAEQFSIGGFSNVRGVRDAASFGNNGGFIRNQVDVGTNLPATITNALGEVRPYVGLDYGHIFGQDERGIATADLAGVSIGLHNRGVKFGFDVGYSHIIFAPQSVTDRDVVFAGGSVNF